MTGRYGAVWRNLQFIWPRRLGDRTTHVGLWPLFGPQAMSAFAPLVGAKRTWRSEQSAVVAITRGPGPCYNARPEGQAMKSPKAKSRVRKQSIIIAGHKTSVSLED